MDGVYFEEICQMWRVRVYYRGQTLNFGYFDDLEDAIRERKRLKAIYNDSNRIPPRPPNIFDKIRS